MPAYSAEAVEAEADEAEADVVPDVDAGVEAALEPHPAKIAVNASTAAVNMLSLVFMRKPPCGNVLRKSRSRSYFWDFTISSKRAYRCKTARSGSGAPPMPIEGCGFRNHERSDDEDGCVRNGFLPLRVRGGCAGHHPGLSVRSVMESAGVIARAYDVSQGGRDSGSCPVR